MFIPGLTGLSDANLVMLSCWRCLLPSEFMAYLDGLFRSVPITTGPQDAFPNFEVRHRLYLLRASRKQVPGISSVFMQASPSASRKQVTGISSVFMQASPLASHKQVPGISAVLLQASPSRRVGDCLWSWHSVGGLGLKVAFSGACAFCAATLRHKKLGLCLNMWENKKTSLRNPNTSAPGYSLQCQVHIRSLQC